MSHLHFIKENPNPEGMVCLYAVYNCRPVRDTRLLVKFCTAVCFQSNRCPV